MEQTLLKDLDASAGKILASVRKLGADTDEAEKTSDVLECAKLYQSKVLADMEELRAIVDQAEALIPEQFLPYPSYGELLFSLR